MFSSLPRWKKIENRNSFDHLYFQILDEIGENILTEIVGEEEKQVSSIKEIHLGQSHSISYCPREKEKAYKSDKSDILIRYYYLKMKTIFINFDSALSPLVTYSQCHNAFYVKVT